MEALIAHIRAELHTPEDSARRILGVVIGAIEAELLAGRRVKVNGFGTFFVRDLRPTFTPSETLCARVLDRTIRPEQARIPDGPEMAAHSAPGGSEDLRK